MKIIIIQCAIVKKNRLAEQSSALVQRGYRYRSVQEAFSRVRLISRSQALQRVFRDRDVKDRVRFVVRFDPRLPDLNNVLKRSWSVMSEDPAMSKVFPSPPMVCYQRVQSIGEMLVRAKLPANQRRSRSRAPDRGFKPCRDRNCPVCDHLEVKDRVIKTVKCSSTGEVLEMKSSMTCTTTNLVYCITCKRGGRVCPTHPQYIGETSKSLRERLRGHRGTVVQPSQVNTSAPVGLHFRQSNHSVCDLEIVPIERNRRDNITRKVRESFFIKKYDTVENGLNIKC